MARAARDTQGEKARPLGAQPPALGARESHLQSRRFHRLLPCRYGAGRSGHDARPADAVWRAEAECGVRGCSARGRCLQSSGGGKGGGIHTDGVDAGGAGGATTTTTTTTTSCVCVDGAYGPACELGCENNSMLKTAAQRLRPIRPAARPTSARSSAGRPPASVSLGQLADTFWLAGPTCTGPVFHIGTIASTDARATAPVCTAGAAATRAGSARTAPTR